MSTLRVLHTVDDLADDYRGVAVRARRDMVGIVRKELRDGNKIAKGFAKSSAGAHGKHYHRAFSTEMHQGFGLFGNIISGEYGPDAAMPQGGMSFEFGSRNQPPHLDLARSADRIAPAFRNDAASLKAKWFG